MAFPEGPTSRRQGSGLWQYDIASWNGIVFRPSRSPQSLARYPIYALYIAGGWLLPGRKRVVPYSIQTLKRLRPALFHQDLIALLDLLQQNKIKPLIARRFPLREARQAQELLGSGGVIGKIGLVRNTSSPGSAMT